MCFDIQVHLREGWRSLILYEAEDVDTAKAYCDRALISFKVNARIVERPEDEIVYEKFYNRCQDPDARDWDREPEDDLEVNWQKEGF